MPHLQVGSALVREYSKTLDGGVECCCRWTNGEREARKKGGYSTDTTNSMKRRNSEVIIRTNPVGTASEKAKPKTKKLTAQERWEDSHKSKVSVIHKVSVEKNGFVLKVAWRNVFVSSEPWSDLHPTKRYLYLSLHAT